MALPYDKQRREDFKRTVEKVKENLPRLDKHVSKIVKGGCKMNHVFVEYDESRRRKYGNIGIMGQITDTPRLSGERLSEGEPTIYIPIGDRRVLRDLENKEIWSGATTSKALVGPKDRVYFAGIEEFDEVLESYGTSFEEYLSSL